jgi:hypothetical protein
VGIKRPAATEELWSCQAELLSDHIMAGMAFAFSPEMVKQTMDDGDENRKFGERDARLVLMTSQSRRGSSRMQLHQDQMLPYSHAFMCLLLMTMPLRWKKSGIVNYAVDVTEIQMTGQLYYSIYDACCVIHSSLH